MKNTKLSVNTMICISLAPRSLAELRKELTKAARFTSLIELRADRLDRIPFNLLPRPRGKKLIFTCRPRWAGGAFKKSESRRIKILQTAIDSNRFDYVDVESAVFKKIKRARNRTKLIVSYHNFKRTPSNLIAIYRTLARLKPDVIKIATRARDISDNLRIFQLAPFTRHRIPLIAFCLGEDGLISRVLYKKFGFRTTYASLTPDQSTAPGQLNHFELKYLYRADRLNDHTRIYGLIGDPVKHSLSPLIFNSIFRQEKLNAVYLPFRFNNLKQFKKLTAALNVQGYSVTSPYKSSIMKYLDEIDLFARQVGSINTIYHPTDRRSIRATNTDSQGAWKSLTQKIRLRYPDYYLAGRTALIIGTGGVARAIGVTLKLTGMHVIFAGRHYPKARKIARAFRGQAIRFSELFKVKPDVDLIINATPIGTRPETNKSPVPKRFFRKNMIVFDMVYNPAKTKFLKEAHQKGCQTISGLIMFLHQAEAQWQLFKLDLEQQH
ncbi:MAG: shikimate dehydrogenase [Planctomycetes bacterium]|nr:shikimate dehydrogenase [Planctomycetota bacterium]